MDRQTKYHNLAVHAPRFNHNWIQQTRKDQDQIEERQRPWKGSISVSHFYCIYLENTTLHPLRMFMGLRALAQAFAGSAAKSSKITLSGIADINS